MKLLILSAAFFLFTLVLAFVTKSEPPKPVTVASQSQIHEVVAATPRPTLSPESLPPLSATSIYIMDAKSGDALFAYNADLLVSPASTTKMLTALVASGFYDHHEVQTVPAFKVDGQKMGLFAGEKITTESLLYGLLVFSGNDAAEALARIYPDGRSGFMEAMNIEARKHSMISSVFKNPTGLDDATHVSTAREMAILGAAIMKDPYLRQIVGTTKATVTSVDGKFVHRLVSTNDLLTSVPGVLGIKTGWTEEAHENLVTYIDRDDHPIIISLFGSDDRFGETKKLIEWAYLNAKW